MSKQLPYQYLPDIADAEGPVLNRITQTFRNESGVTINDGDTVAIDLSTITNGIGSGVERGPAVADSPFVFGVADEEILDDEDGQVVMMGVKEGVLANAAVTAGSRVQQDAVLAQVINAGSNTERNLGLALTAAVGGRATIWVNLPY